MDEEGLLVRMRVSYRLFFYASLLLFFAGFAISARAQNFLHNSEASVSAFGQFTSSVSGNGISLNTTDSLGGQAAFRHSFHWWLGFEGSYSYTRFNEYYSALPYSVQHNFHEFAGSYLVSGSNVLGFRPFALAGLSGIIFSPSLNGGQNLPWQGETGLNFGVGAEHALMTSHFGIRIEYRGLYYKAPDFGDPALKTGSSRLTSEPLVGVYYRF